MSENHPLPHTPFVLIIKDGWGINPNSRGNAVANARIPVISELLATCPHTTLETCGESVGLPAGIMGNSEVGHLNIGAGRIVYQDLTRINKAIREGDFYRNPVLLQAMNIVRQNDSRLHLIGLASDAGVHSAMGHLFALLEMARENGVRKVFIHAFTDGRDSPPTSSLGYLRAMQAKMKELGIGEIATISGRYYAMDRDNRWHRTQKAYDALVKGEGHRALSIEEAIESAYQRKLPNGEFESDEFIEPTVLSPHGSIKDGDAVIAFNYRPDRMVQITQALVDPNFTGFDRRTFPQAFYVCTTLYKREFDLPIAFGPQSMKNLLVDILSDRGIRQLRTAETEKYRHVTSFFNGGRLEPYLGEDRVLIPSPKVPTYDMQPEMSAEGVKDTVIESLKNGSHDVIVVNFANCDMVGHTGSIPAAIQAVETVDRCVGEILVELKKAGGAALITADHGNAEEMIDEETGLPKTSHSLFPVNFILVAPDQKRYRFHSSGVLADISPTILDLLGLPQPEEMTGRSLLEKV